MIGIFSLFQKVFVIDWYAFGAVPGLPNFEPIISRCLPIT